MKKVLMIFTCILFLCGCDYDFRLYLDNQTSDTLCVYLALDFETAYPDTTLPIDPNRACLATALPHEKTLAFMTNAKGENIIKNLPQETLSVFIIHADTLLKYTWQEIRDDYKILSRYDLSLKDLQMLNFTIPYPPTEAMKNMKMYPPYED